MRTVELRSSKSFRTDYKKLSNAEKAQTDLVIQKLLCDAPLETKYRDHALRGNYVGYRECHVRPDLLLVYKKADDGNTFVLYLVRVSSHTNIFDIH